MDTDKHESMKKDYTKTDNFLLLIQAICKAPRLTLSEAKVREILGNPSKSQYHKLINELLEDRGERKKILLKKKDENGNIQFQLNECDWTYFLEGKSEIQYILKSYREMGHLLPNINVDDFSVKSQTIDRRFHYLCKFQVREDLEHLHTHLEKIIRALVGNTKLYIQYPDKESKKPKTVQIVPLTIVQYRDDLYLVACKDDFKEGDYRHYKVSRMLAVTETRNKFRYPSEQHWNPSHYFAKSSGIFVGPEKKARFKVYGDSRTILREKKFFNSQLVNDSLDFDEYECSYTNIEEFVGFLFIYGQDIEIISDAALKKMFREKAEKILKRNS